MLLGPHGDLFDLFPIHFCLPKNESKRAPGCAGPSGCLALLAVDGTLNNSAPPQTVLTSFSVNSSDALRHRTGLQTKKYVFLPSHAAEQRSQERISDSAERKRYPDVARSWRAAQGSPTQSDQVIGCTFFWFVFFMQVKKMNVKRIFISHPFQTYSS